MAFDSWISLRRRCAALCCVLLLIACCDGGSSDRATHAGITFVPMELSYVHAAPLEASLRAPDGTTLRSLSFSREQRQVIRMTPTMPGRWTYEVRSGASVVERGSLQVAPSRNSGFIGIRGHAFERSNGTAFIAIGENRINLYDPSWNWHALSIERYLEHMARHGMTAVRVFIVSDVENEQEGSRNAGVLEPELGRFDEHVAEQLDRIFRAAAARNMGVVLVAFALGFSPDDDWKSWHDNPYAAERGGPAASRFEFFESPVARAQAAQRIRYLAARFAPYPSLLAIDLLNEPEWDGGIPEVAWKPWAEAMAEVWRRADPYHHAVTLGSVGLHWNIEGDERAWWSSTPCDVVQWHLYGPQVYEVHSLADEMTRKVRESWSYGKPVLVGEFAYGGEAKPAYDHTHVGLWSASFAGAAVLAHSAPPFNVDSDELMTPERARHFIVLKDVLARLGNSAPVAAQANRGARAWALFGAKAGAVWILAPKEGYGAEFSNVHVGLTAPAGGAWEVQWLDDVTGKAIGAAARIRTTGGGTLSLDVPPFTRHIAGSLRWTGDSPAPRSGVSSSEVRRPSRGMSLYRIVRNEAATLTADQ
jgi:cellulase (glycosyl hydrolase family 5)